MAAWVTTLSAAEQSAAGTPHWAAAAWTSMARAAAPPLRTYSTEPRSPRLPPVDMSPQARLRARLSCGATYSARTWRQSASISSATSWARPVSVPCPISVRAMRTTTVSSGWMTAQMPTSAGPAAGAAAPGARVPGAAAWADAEGSRQPSANAPATVETTKPRRLMCMAMPPYAAPLATEWMAARTRL